MFVPAEGGLKPISGIDKRRHPLVRNFIGSSLKIDSITGEIYASLPVRSFTKVATT